jgi:predicted MPP superfamily phosphohydrolase
MSPPRLEFGLHRALHIREERVSARHDACRLMYVSDIHLRPKRSANLARQVIRVVRESAPDGVLLGGDLVDGSSELDQLRDLVRHLHAVAPVLAIGGNHDRSVGMTRVRDAVVSGGGDWIHETSVRITHGARVIAVAGPNAVSATEGDVRILCAHHPSIWRTAREAGYDLVLAGHLHGCQMVAFEYRDRLFPGALFYQHCFIRSRHGPARLVVSRGVSDLVPVRWRCPREVVLCHV